MNWLKTFLLVVFVLEVYQVQSADPYYMDLYNQANEAYKAGAYDSAQTLYTEIAQNGLSSSALYYNLGNTHFKEGNIPAAILYYERALRIDPRDPDIRFNLEIARGMTTDKIEPVDAVFITRWWNDLARSVPLGIWTSLFFLLLVTAAFLFGLFFLSKNVRYRQLGLIGGATTPSLLAVVGDHTRDALHRRAVAPGARVATCGPARHQPADEDRCQLPQGDRVGRRLPAPLAAPQLPSPLPMSRRSSRTAPTRARVRTGLRGRCEGRAAPRSRHEPRWGECGRATIAGFALEAP